jgi:hypothetical protein
MPLALFEEDLCMPGWGMLYTFWLDLGIILPTG